MTPWSGMERDRIATGGFASSAVWRQVMADVFGREVLFPREQQSVCLGAAILGMTAMGWLDSLSAVNDMVVIERSHKPQSPARALYDELRTRYEVVVGALSSVTRPDLDPAEHARADGPV